MGGGVGQVFKDIGSALTAGIVDFDRGRVNVPFSGAQMRQATKSTINAVTMSGLTAPGSREDLNRSLDTNTARVIGKVAGAAAAAATGAGLASQLGHVGSTAAEVGDAIEMTGNTAGVLGQAGAVAPTAAASTAALTTAATPMTTAAQAAQAAAAAAAPAAEAAGTGLTAGQALLGSTALTVGGTAYQAMTNKPPKPPGPPDTSALDQAAATARNAAQSTEAEARRQRNARRQSSVLSNVLPGVSSVGISPATLQPAQARRSVLG